MIGMGVGRFSGTSQARFSGGGYITTEITIHSGPLWVWLDGIWYQNCFNAAPPHNSDGGRCLARRGPIPGHQVRHRPQRLLGLVSRRPLLQRRGVEGEQCVGAGEGGRQGVGEGGGPGVGRWGGGGDGAERGLGQAGVGPHTACGDGGSRRGTVLAWQNGVALES